MRRKKRIYGIATFLAILLGRMMLKKNRLPSFDPVQYHGSWSFTDENKQPQQLLITSTFDLSINGHSLKTKVVELNKQQLTLQDQYGFYLTLSYSNQTFYDESTDITYPLKKQHEKII
ncbi:DUF4828 domain-containing protein [Enterococcus ratti]|uniref:DUF4828 domain-containing protein n=1 Tax=Enterococcus ratti TaxID=150033 RepID=A0A1L8WDY1_9ENTE|nr:DUF4828 domain-containing protein [Enterococcus ratti]OJG79230.1 hypothetical protein RV14_GL001055 [Enterococcus ratti]